MATNTTNFSLVKPAYSDTADIATINGNMDKVDASLNAIGKGLAIISKNNTHDAITKDQFVYVHGHGSLSEGLYKANNNIAANGTLNSTNLTAVSGGLGAQMASLSGSVSALSDQIGNMAQGTNIHNEADLPSAYPLGLSAFSIQDNGSLGWATATQMNYAVLTTFKVNTNYALQIIANYQGKMSFRASTESTSWGSWKVITT